MAATAARGPLGTVASQQPRRAPSPRPHGRARSRRAAGPAGHRWSRPRKAAHRRRWAAAIRAFPSAVWGPVDEPPVKSAVGLAPCGSRQESAHGGSPCRPAEHPIVHCRLALSSRCRSILRFKELRWRWYAMSIRSARSLVSMFCMNVCDAIASSDQPAAPKISRTYFCACSSRLAHRRARLSL